MKHMLKTLVTPHVDYNSQLWIQIECSEIEKIEKNQRDFFQKYPSTMGPELLGPNEHDENVVFTA